MTLFEIELAEILLVGKLFKDGTQWNYYLHGILRLRSTVVDQVPHGPFTLYYANGSVWMQGSYTRGVREDNWKTYLPSGAQL